MLILVLGIISLAALVFWPLAPLWMILGLVAWVMGRNDLRKIKANQMDPDSSGLTKAGWICGIIGTSLSSLVTLSCFGFINAVALPTHSRPAVIYTQPVQGQPGAAEFPWAADCAAAAKGTRATSKEQRTARGAEEGREPHLTYF